MSELSRELLLEALIHVADVLMDIDSLPATDGNFSVRLSTNKIMITRANLEKRSLTPNSFVDVDLRMETPRDCSSEWPMHRALYMARPEVRCILHAHSPYLSTFAAAHRVPNIDLLAEAQQAVGEIVLVPFARPGTKTLGDSLLEISATAMIYLLANHGAVSVGQSVPEALYGYERAELLARVEWQSCLLGGGQPLS